MKLKVGDIVKLNKRCKEIDLQYTNIRLGDCGVIIKMKKHHEYTKKQPVVRFFTGDIHWVNMHYISKLKNKSFEKIS